MYQFPTETVINLSRRSFQVLTSTRIKRNFDKYFHGNK